MAIGNPINLTSNVEGKNISVIATAGQTQFTVTGGYRINQISVFRNGVRLVDGRDYTALDGSIVTLLSAATVADVIEFQVFDDFRVSDALNVNSGGTVNGNVTVTGILSTTNLSIGSSISLDATTGIITAVQVIGATLTGTATTAINAQGLTGTPDITVNNIVAAAGTFSGVLTYEDVTNIDSLGIVTARTGVDITANGLVVNAGVSTFAADVSIADKIVHTGDTNTAIRFPSADTFTVETAGVQRLEVDSTGDLGLVGIATATGLVVVAGSGVYAGHTGIITAVTFDGNLTGNVTGSVTGAATQVTVADESSDTTCFPLFATGATGDLAPKSGTNLTFNSSSGALTATSFVGALTGDVTGNATGLSGTPNIDCGTGSFTGDVDIADKIIHTGDTNTAIRFPAADTFAVETAGSEALRVDSSQRLSVGFAGLDIAGANIQESGSSGCSLLLHRNDTTVVNDDSLGLIRFYSNAGSSNQEHARISGLCDGTAGADDKPGRLTFYTTADGASSPTERLRITAAGLVRVPDNGKFTAGAGDDLQIYHNGSSNFIEATNGSLFIRGSDLVLEDAGGNDYITCSDGGTGGTVTLKHLGSAKLATKSDGIDITGELQCDSLDVDGIVDITGEVTLHANLDLQDNDKIMLGTGDDLEIYHDGSNSYVKDAGTGELRLEADAGGVRIQRASGHTGLFYNVGGAVELYHDNSKKLETKTDGVDITGELQCDSLDVDGNVDITGTTTLHGNLDLQDDDQILLGTGDDLKIYHNGSVNYFAADEIRVVNNAVSETMAKFIANGAVELFHNDSIKLATSASGVSVTGDFTASGNVTAYSDISLKENIETIPNALDKVLNLRGVEFDRIDKEDNTHEIGVIAQEVEEVIPEVVLTNTEGIKSVAYGNLVGLLIESIKELKAEVNDLKAQVEG